MYKFVFLVCFVSLAVVAYDFSDSEYNEYLMQDLLDYNQEEDDVFAARNKRHTTTTENKDDDKKCKSRKHGMWKCCNDNNNDSTFDKFKEMKKQCFQEIRGTKNEEQSVDMFSCEKVNKTKEEFVCVTQCVGQKLNIVDKDGNLIESAVKEHVKNDISSSEWQKAVSDTVSQTCIAEANEAVKANPPENGKCNPASIKFSHCMWREMIKACPKDLQSDSNKCVKLREKLDKGEKVEYHFHRFHHHSRSENSESDDK
ncbi:hypothetical protein Bhyg_02794 [Pseudolycoriella hygida]|uniref:Uncharacterized protein n=1 Tax=Pseudolycoriella hygida TaxID=35572 RepID=A0A9Q0ND98_9DIPT|nr:hypothetical protein Bhyg_02794 [Pseudolycoriella hygida]